MLAQTGEEAGAMLYVRPDFYDDFHCLAAACRHSCCVGWEIDVDGDSLDYYQSIAGELGEELRRQIALEPSPHFRLGAGERCPFLQQDGLCRLICELGEDSLCDICALHPRFFEEIGEDELWGLGLSCEAAATTRSHSAGESLPMESFLPSTMAAEESRRCTSSSRLISSEKTATVWPECSPT